MFAPFLASALKVISVLTMLAVAVRLGAPVLIARRRARRGRCVHCGYPSGPAGEGRAPAAVCPECGKPPARREPASLLPGKHLTIVSGLLIVAALNAWWASGRLYQGAWALVPTTGLVLLADHAGADGLIGRLARKRIVYDNCWGWQAGLLLRRLNVPMARRDFEQAVCLRPLDPMGLLWVLCLGQEYDALWPTFGGRGIEFSVPGTKQYERFDFCSEEMPVGFVARDPFLLIALPRGAPGAVLQCACRTWANAHGPGSVVVEYDGPVFVRAVPWREADAGR